MDMLSWELISDKSSVPQARQAPELRFIFLLLGIVALCLVPRLILTFKQFISYDGWWHIMVARTGNWRATFEDIRDNAHPPLFYILLHYLVNLGHSRFIYRLGVVVPGLAAIFYVGLIASKLYASRTLAILAAAAFGFSMTMIEISVDVRSYSLSLLFVLAAFYYFTEWLQDAGGRKGAGAFLLFCSLASLGITTEYFAVFFLLASFAAALILYLRYRELRALVSVWLGRYGKIAALSSLIPLLTIAILYRRHIRYLPKFFNHIEAFYWHPHLGASLGAFLLSNLLRDANYFSPLPLSSVIVLVLLCLALVGLVAVYALQGAYSPRRIAAAMPGLILVLLVCELALFAVAGRYPFGGEMRQQCIVFPFLVLGLFALLDWALRVSPPRLLPAAGAIVAVAITANFAHGWRQIQFASESDLFLPPYQRFMEAFPHPRVVFTDQYSSVLYMIGANASHWRFIEKLGKAGLVGVQRIYEFKITSPSGEEQILLRDKDEWNAELGSWYFYDVIANSLRAARVNEADLFFSAHDAADRSPAANQALEGTIRTLASRAGLDAGKIVLYPRDTFLHVNLRK
ncbi:MAG TPA: hypothetical protein VHZ07_27895 [Bryobacteraceae bacterium]|jgi:hypothetical protein|nr:hypothetical protein [Bryobacteraceae bacterium]